MGRFAPSPTGALHLGSLVTAMASYLQAKSQSGQWLIRIEDVDHTRCNPKTASLQLAQLQKLGLNSDGPVLMQSSRTALYQQALEQLQALGVVYACDCSRQLLHTLGHEVYPGTCRNRQLGFTGRALRLNLAAPPAQQLLKKVSLVNDLRQKPLTQNLLKEVGDFVLRRADGVFSYQLAVVVDDANQGITEVVRGVDLLDNTPRQQLLQQLLGLPTPSYRHINLVLASDGNKLSKQNGAVALQVDTEEQCIAQLIEAAHHLNVAVSHNHQEQSVAEVWQLLLAAWP